MKYKNFIKIIFFILVLINFNTLKANERIVYIDINKLMSDSLVGKSFINKIKIYEEKNSQKLNKIIKNLRSEEKKLISQKNVLDKTEFEKKYKKLQIDFSEYKKSIKNFSNELNKKKIKSNSLVMDGLQPILLDYAKNNSISIILDKKNVIIAQSDLDITDTIIKNLNIKMKDVSF